MNSIREEPAVVLLGCGDVGPIHEPVAQYSEFVRATLATGDIRFAQCERVYSSRGALQVHANSHSRVDPRLASVFADCNFNVVSLASNHALDWGPDALADTREVLEGYGIQVIGAGADLAQAREPARFEVNSVRVAVLAYCSVPKEGFVATANKPGVAPLRAITYYEPIDYQPGAPVRVRTFPNPGDLLAMSQDIRKAKQASDVVVISCHWGVHHVPKVLADYEAMIAQEAFRSGAELILAHHAHVPKAVEVIDGKVCFHGLSNFIMTTSERVARKSGPSDPDNPRMQFGPDGLRSLIARAELTKAGAHRVSFLPVLIDKEVRPEILRSDDARFQNALEYMESISSDVCHRFTVDGDEVVVT